MVYKIFQTATATLKEMSVDNFGNNTVVKSFAVEIDPVLGYKKGFNAQGEEITGVSTIITATDDIDVTKRTYHLDYLGRTYRVEQMIPYYSIGANILEHVEVLLR
jgi:hypothetical protein